MKVAGFTLWPLIRDLLIVNFVHIALIFPVLYTGDDFFFRNVHASIVTIYGVIINLVDLPIFPFVLGIDEITFALTLPQQEDSIAIAFRNWLIGGAIGWSLYIFAAHGLSNLRRTVRNSIHSKSAIQNPKSH